MSEDNSTSLMEKLDAVVEERQQAETQTDEPPTDEECNDEVSYLTREFERLSQRLDTVQLTLAIVLGYMLISAMA